MEKICSAEVPKEDGLAARIVGRVGWHVLASNGCIDFGGTVPFLDLPGTNPGSFIASRTFQEKDRGHEWRIACAGDSTKGVDENMNKCPAFSFPPFFGPFGNQNSLHFLRLDRLEN